MKTLIAIVLPIALICWAAPVDALNQPLGINLGFTNFLDGAPPGPGWYLTEYYQLIHAADIENDAGLPENADLDVFVNITQLIYQSDVTFLGGNPGFDIMILTPYFMPPNYYPYEELANEMWHDIIRSVKGVFNGQVGVVVNRYGFLEGICGQEDWSKYDYYQEADIVYYYMFRLLLDKYRTNENPSLEEMRGKFSEYLDDLEKQASDAGVKLSIVAVFYSYENAVNEGKVEFSDIGNPAIQALRADWQHQADAYEALFQAAEGRTEIVRIVPFGYWWDDAMDPETARPRISIWSSQRNKNAEGVIKKSNVPSSSGQSSKRVS